MLASRGENDDGTASQTTVSEYFSNIWALVDYTGLSKLPRQ